MILPEADKHAILLTGSPGVGKTTAIRRIAAGLDGRRIRGFVTDEVRVGGERRGFRLETFDGRSAVLAHVDIRSPDRVGKYGVDVEALDDVVGEALALDPGAIYLVDEIGKMECLSGRFVAAMEALLDSDLPVIATVAARGEGLIDRAKRRADVGVLTVTRANRDDVPARAIAWITARARMPGA